MNHATRYLRWCLTLIVAVVAVGALCAAPALAQPAEEMQGPPAADTGGMKTVAVLSVASYDELIGDVGFLGSLAGQPQASQMAEGGIALFTQGRGLASIDRTMPWGLIVQTDGMQFVPVVCLPVTKLDDLLEVAENYGAKVADVDGGVKEVSLPNGKTLYVAADGPWAFVGQTAAALARLPAKPQETLAELVGDYDVAVMFSIQNVPEMYRQMALAALQAGVQSGLANQQGTDQQRELQRQLAEAQQKQIVMMIQELDSLTVGWAVDSEKQNTYLDVVTRFLPDSTLAKQLAANSKPTTNLAGFYQPSAAMTMTLVNKGDPELMKENIAQFKAAIDGAREQVNQKIDENSAVSDEQRQAMKDAASNLFDVVEATVKSGQIDGGAALQLSPDSMTLVAGMIVQQPEKIEAALKKLEAAAGDDPQFPGIQWNAASHAGVHFDTIRLPVPADQEPLRKMLGEETELAIGIGPNAVYVALGRDWETAINQALDASAAEPDKAVPLAEFSMSLGQIMQTAAALGKEEDRAKTQMLADMLRDEAQGLDHVRMIAQIIPNGERVRIEVEEGVLRVIGKAAAQAQQAQQAQQQGMQGPQ